jgi:hypothetical protein
MKFFDFGRFALSISTAVAFLAGCGGSSIGAPDAMPQSPAAATHEQHGGSWIRTEATIGALLYATGGCSGTCVFSYPGGEVVGSLATSGDAVCTDSSGNVFITESEHVVEYAHGSSTPSATLSLPGTDGWGCSVDPTTGNLAVVFSSTAGNIAIFAGARGEPTIYSANVQGEYCGYDSAGNLFVGGYKDQGYSVSELPAGGSGFNVFPIDAPIGTPGQIQWDGTYITWQSSNAQGAQTVSRLEISGSQAVVTGTTHFKGIKLQPLQSWLYGGVIVVPYAEHGAKSNEIGIWAYPKGGKATKVIQNFGSYNRHKVRLQGLAISVAPNR